MNSPLLFVVLCFWVCVFSAARAPDHTCRSSGGGEDDGVPSQTCANNNEANKADTVVKTAESSAPAVETYIRYTKPARTGNHNGINIDNPHTAFGTKDPTVFASQHGSVPRSLLPKDISEAPALENELEPVHVNVYNARGRNFTLMKDGFQLATLTKTDHRDGILPTIHKGGDVTILDDYLRTIERMAMRITGAKAAYVYNNFTWRSLSSDEMNYGDYAHTDVGQYSWCVSSTPRLQDPSRWPPQLKQIAAAAVEPSMMTNVTKYAAVTVWRLLQSDHEQSHLGFLDHRTLREGDMVNFTMLAANDTFGSNYRLKYQEETDHHRWYYYPQLDKDRELLFFLAHDSTHEVLPIVHSQVHAAFQAKIDSEAPSRRSVDSRLLLVF